MKVSSFAVMPVCLLLFCWLTVGAGASVDNGVVNLYGLPLAWYTPSLVTSGGYEIAIGPMLVDLAIYGLLAGGLVWVGAKWFSLGARARRIWGMALWIGAVGSVIFSLVVFSGDAHTTWWRLNSGVPNNASKSYFVSVGIQPRPLLDRAK
jgi:hypothetical protein